MFENRALRGLFGPVKGEIAEGWRKFLMRNVFGTSALTVSSDGNRWPRRCFSFLQFAKHMKSKRAESGLYGGWGGVQKWSRELDVSFYHQVLENVIVCHDKCLNKFGKYVEK
jgi:hypothetical protein